METEAFGLQLLVMTNHNGFETREKLPLTKFKGKGFLAISAICLSGQQSLRLGGRNDVS
jgi:hypothetical protein